LDEVRWLIAREIPHLRRYARALTKDPDRADDLVQDCLLRALRKRHLWRRSGSIRGWLFRILYRLFLSGESRRRWIEREVPLEQAPAAMDGLASSSPGPLALDVADALAGLPAEQRATVALVAIEGLSYDECSNIMGVSIGTVRSRLSRGREALRNRLATGGAAPVLRRVK